MFSDCQPVNTHTVTHTNDMRYSYASFQLKYYTQVSWAPAGFFLGVDKLGVWG